MLSASGKGKIEVSIFYIIIFYLLKEEKKVPPSTGVVY